MGPFVLILSYGSTKPIEIVQKLHAAKNNSNDISAPQDIKIGEATFSVYEYNIKNKYFETIVKLLPYEEPINTIPADILKETEAVIVSFDCLDKSFLIHIPKLCELVEKNNIELSLLITAELNDDCNEGLSYADVKEACKTSFDVIETLSKNNDDDDDDNNDDGKDDVNESVSTTNQEDFSEIIEALENHVWSNVASPSGSKKVSTTAATDDLDEEQLEAYEHLLTNIVNFKSNSANLNRDQLLDQAEKLAEMFSNFMGDD